MSNEDRGFFLTVQSGSQAHTGRSIEAGRERDQHLSISGALAAIPHRIIEQSHCPLTQLS